MNANNNRTTDRMHKMIKLIGRTGSIALLGGVLFSSINVKAQEAEDTLAVEDVAVAEVAATPEVTEEAVKMLDDATADEIEDGAKLFGGGKRFENGGPSCMSCHNVNNDMVMPGGLLAKDLTNVYGRFGEAGIQGMLGVPPFPAMAEAYKNKQITQEEIYQLTAFFKKADAEGNGDEAAAGGNILLFGGIGGLCVILLLVLLMWSNRKKESVKQGIVDRQLKSY